jgi:hypothetical protein
MSSGDVIIKSMKFEEPQTKKPKEKNNFFPKKMYGLHV